MLSLDLIVVLVLIILDAKKLKMAQASPASPEAGSIQMSSKIFFNDFPIATQFKPPPARHKFLILFPFEHY